MAGADDTARAESGLSAASQRIRETAKWLIVTFGAVAGVLVGGLQLTTLPALERDDRDAALFGYALGVAGAALAIIAAAFVMTAGRRALHDLEGTGGNLSLRKKLDKLTDLRGGYSSISELVTKTNEAIIERTKAWEDWQRDAAANEVRYQESKARAKVLTPIADRLLEVAAFEHLRRTWFVCLAVIGVGAALSATGVAIFAANAAQGDEEEQADAPAPAVAFEPVTVRVRLSGDGMRVHGPSLGARCPTGRIDAVATAATEATVDLLVVPTSGSPCAPRALTLKRREGVVVARNQVELPDLTANPVPASTP